MNILSSGLLMLVRMALRLLALVVHECSHGFVSTKLGDPTPRIQGRLTLNPLAHLDPFGTILMLLTGFGWARPVEVNQMYYKDRKKGMALVAVAGPLSNFLLAFVSLLLIGVFSLVTHKFSMPLGLTTFINQIFVYSAQINLCFMVFNLIPIPPLDGSRILGMFLSDKTYYTLMQYERYSMILIMVLSLSGAFDRIIGTGVYLIFGGMIGAVEKLFNFLMMLI